MKIMYNKKEVANTNRSYNTLSQKPSINNVVLEGNMTLNDLRIYSKWDTDQLIAASRSVKQVSALPSETVANTMYYVGPNSEGTYHVYLYDSDNLQIDLGSSEVETYDAGVGLYVSDDNKLNVGEDSDYLYIDSNNKLNINAVTEVSSVNKLVTAGAVYNFVMTGATASAAGKRGLVPAPTKNDYYKYLCGDGTWKYIPAYNGLGSGSSGIYHTNSVTEMTTPSLGLLKYDAQGHITGFTSKSVINNLTSTSTTDPLSAYQGKVLNDKFASYSKISDIVDNLTSTATNKPLSANQGYVLYNEINDYMNDLNVAKGKYMYFQINGSGSKTINFTTSTGFPNMAHIIVSRDGNACEYAVDGYGSVAKIIDNWGKISVSTTKTVNNEIKTITISSSYQYAVRCIISTATSDK